MLEKHHKSGVAVCWGYLGWRCVGVPWVAVCWGTRGPTAEADWVRDNANQLRSYECAHGGGAVTLDAVYGLPHLISPNMSGYVIIIN